MWLLFFVVVLLRAQATYWIARLVTAHVLSHTHPSGGWRARIHAWLRGDSARHGVDLVRRWGAPAVTISFLTVGAQTVVNAAAGVVRMPFGRYLVAMLPGCAAWALVWTTIGMSAFYAALGAGLATPWAVVLAGVALLAVTAAVSWSRCARARRRS